LKKAPDGDQKCSTLPRDDPILSDDHKEIMNKANTLRTLSKDDVSKDDKSGSVKTPEAGEKKTVLSRTSSIEIVKSKTLLLQKTEEVKNEKSTLDVETFETVEFKVKVNPSPPPVPARKSLSSRLEQVSDKRTLKNGDSDGEMDGSSEDDDEQKTKIVLSSVPQKREKKESGTGMAGKPPTVPKSPSDTPASPTKKSSEPNGSNSLGVSRSNSFTSDAGTQTPRIKAKAKLYFDVDGESVTASEESLSDAMAKETLQREIEILKEELARKEN